MDYPFQVLALSRVRQPGLRDRRRGQRAASDPLNQDVWQTSGLSRCSKASARTCWEDHPRHLSVSSLKAARLGLVGLLLLIILSSHFNSVALSVEKY